MIKVKLTEAMNTYNPALYTLKEKGYEVSAVVYEEVEETWWIATKEDVVVIGFNPLSLLGLVILTEQYGESWQEYNKIDIYKDIIANSESL